MKILVGHDGFDALIAQVSRDVWMSQNARCIENVEALVFHCTHIEIINGDNVKKIKVILETVTLLIPTHRRL